MKRICSVFIALVLVLTVTGCGLDTNKKSDKVSIVTTMFAAYDFAREIAGDRADITLLLKPGADSHSYEPSPKDMAAIDNCDIFIYTGGENDDWVDRIAASSSNKDMKIIKMLDGVDMFEEDLTEGRAQHAVQPHEEGNGH
uniref:metal ABC transporter substrate-binding protein n=1 Tax=Eshraghiella crossota TaxID=45851 RepID=UPI004024EB4F